MHVTGLYDGESVLTEEVRPQNRCPKSNWKTVFPVRYELEKEDKLTV
jgi:hypothetical protein